MVETAQVNPHQQMTAASAYLDTVLIARRCSADFQSAVSPIYNRQRGARPMTVEVVHASRITNPRYLKNRVKMHTSKCRVKKAKSVKGECSQPSRNHSGFAAFAFSFDGQQLRCPHESFATRH
jgi:hypothetical protein